MNVTLEVMPNVYQVERIDCPSRYLWPSDANPMPRVRLFRWLPR